MRYAKARKGFIKRWMNHPLKRTKSAKVDGRQYKSVYKIQSIFKMLLYPSICQEFYWFFFVRHTFVQMNFFVMV